MDRVRQRTGHVKPVSRTTLVEQVAQQILRTISEGRWKIGDKLPSESELCRGFHVGRSTLREALKSLAFAGVLRTRTGEGTYVAEGPPTVRARILAPGFLNTEKNLRDLFEARRVLEGATAALCAERATEEEIEKLEQLVKELQQCAQDPGAQDQKVDVAFHMAMAAASKNEVLTHLLGSIQHLLHEAVVRSRQLPGSHQLACDEHFAIVQALKQRNPRKARRAIHKHLWSFEKVYEILAHDSTGEAKAKAHEEEQPQQARA